MTQSLFESSSVRISCFVDDPIVSLRGTLREQRLNACIIVLTWAALGFPLALSRGQFGHRAKWFGFQVETTTTGVKATLKQELVEDIKEHIKQVENAILIPDKFLRSFVGKCLMPHLYCTRCVPSYRSFGLHFTIKPRMRLQATRGESSALRH